MQTSLDVGAQHAAPLLFMDGASPTVCLGMLRPNCLGDAAPQHDFGGFWVLICEIVMGRGAACCAPTSLGAPYPRENGYACVPIEPHRVSMNGPWHPRVSMHRRSIRLRGRDYSAPGTYLVTICVCSHLFGRVQTGEMILTRFGKIAGECWADLPNHFSHVRLDSFVVMPDHVHGILVLGRRSGRASAIGRVAVGSLGAVVRSFKSAVTARINSERGARPGGIWQRNYFDQIIRSRADLDRVRRYIRDNPVRWGGRHADV